VWVVPGELTAALSGISAAFGKKTDEGSAPG
jgi:hypothetical protein